MKSRSAEQASVRSGAASSFRAVREGIFIRGKARRVDFSEVVWWPEQVVKSRPPSDSSTDPASEAPAWSPRRNVGGARKEATERVTLRATGFETSGWTLNVSRGGLRAIVEDRLTLGVEFELVVGDAAAPRRATLVWSQDQSDGQIVVLRYLDVDGSAPPRDPSAPPQEE